MTYQQVIDKWESHLAHWQKVANDELTLTKEEQGKASWYAYAIKAFLFDLKNMDKEGATNENEKDNVQ